MISIEVIEIRWDRPNGGALVAIGGPSGPAVLAGSRDVERNGIEAEIPLDSVDKRSEIEWRVTNAAFQLDKIGIEISNEDRWQ